MSEILVSKNIWTHLSESADPSTQELLVKSLETQVSKFFKNIFSGKKTI